MEPIDEIKVQEHLDRLINRPVYIHLETTNGAYASHINEKAYTVGAFIRNAEVTFTNAKIIRQGNVFRAGLKMDIGWIYAEGLTDWTLSRNEELLLAGHDKEGRLMVALELSEQPLRY
jgi:hypothetical protein